MLPGAAPGWSTVATLADGEAAGHLWRPLDYSEKLRHWDEYSMSGSALALAARNAQCAGFSPDAAAKCGAIIEYLHALNNTEAPQERASVANTLRATASEVLFQIRESKLASSGPQHWAWEDLDDALHWFETATLAVWRAGRDRAESELFRTLNFWEKRYGSVVSETCPLYVANHFPRTCDEAEIIEPMGARLMLIECDPADAANLPRIADECGVPCVLVEYRRPLALLRFRAPVLGSERDEPIGDLL